MLKRRTEEHAAAQTKLRSVMHLLKKTRPVSSPISKGARAAMDEVPRRNSNPKATIAPGHPPSPTRMTLRSRRILNKSPVSGPPTEESLSQREDERLKMQASFKKNLLYKEINNFITGKQLNEVAEELLRKRETLSQEKQDLLDEQEQLRFRIDELSQNAKLPVDFENLTMLRQQHQETENRVEIINAEVKYVSSRIHSIQLEAAQAQGDELAKMGGSMISLANPPPDMNTSYDNAVEIMKSMDQVEAKKLLELLIEDLIALKLSERTRSLEIQEMEKESEDLRKALQSMRKAAIDANLENEKKILEYENRLQLSRMGQRDVAPAVDAKDNRMRLSIIQDVHDLQGDLDDIDTALSATEISGPRRPSEGPRSRPRAWSVSGAPKEVAMVNAVVAPSLDAAEPTSPNEEHAPGSTIAPESDPISLSIGSMTSSQSFPSLSQLDAPLLAFQSTKERDRNVFERLHREQTISSKAKKKEPAHHGHAADGTPLPVEPVLSVDMESLAPIDKLNSIREAIQRAMRQRSDEKLDGAAPGHTVNHDASDPSKSKQIATNDTQKLSPNK